MGQHLRDSRFVHKPTARPKDSVDLTQNRSRAGGPAADVVASPEVDDEIDTRALERHSARVTLDHTRIGLRGGNMALSKRDQFWIDIEADE